jgi:hypothetical protein
MKENPKHTDHHFKKMSEYKYTLEFVEPRKSYDELQKENNKLKMILRNLKYTANLYNNSKLESILGSIPNLD